MKTLLAATVLALTSVVAAKAQSIDTAQVFKQAAPAVVLIVTQKSGTPLEQGTGVVVSRDGLILSALHVMKGADRALVKLRNGDVYDNVVVAAFDVRRDLVVLKVPAFDLPAVPVGNSNETKEGDPVAMISNPEGLEGSITQGIVSAIRDVGDLGFKAIQTTAAASPGSSGGAILDANGKLIAILSFKVVGGENLNFGIPVNYGRGMLDSHDSFPLNQLTTRLEEGSVRPLSQIGSPTPADISGDWVSLTSGHRFKMRLDDGHAYVERLFTEEQAKLGLTYLCDLKSDKNVYTGTCRAQVPARWYDHWRGEWRSRVCQLDFGMEFGKYSPTRIEGRSQTKGRGEEWSGKDLSDCGKRVPLEWSNFVWIRPN